MHTLSAVEPKLDWAYSRAYRICKWLANASKAVRDSKPESDSFCLTECTAGETQETHLRAMSWREKKRTTERENERKRERERNRDRDRAEGEGASEGERELERGRDRCDDGRGY